MVTDDYLQAIRGVGDEIESIAKGILDQSWTGSLRASSPMLGEMLVEVDRVRQLSLTLDRHLRNSAAEVDRRNLVRLFGIAYDCARDRLAGRQEFVDRLAAVFETW